MDGCLHAQLPYLRCALTALLAMPLFALPHSASNSKAAAINSYLEGQIFFLTIC